MKKILLLALCIIPLTACEHYSEQLSHFNAPNDYNDVSQIEPAAGGELTFKNYLLNEYMTLANYENDVRQDYKAAKYYTQKIDTLKHGQMVSPANLRGRNISSDKKETLAAARSDLIYALRNFAIPENRYSLAYAQSRFDCWVDQAEENYAGETNSFCEGDYTEAMNGVIISNVPLTEEEFYEDFFDVDV